MTGRIAGTFSALSRLGDFNAEVVDDVKDEINGAKKIELTSESSGQIVDKGRVAGLRTEFHYNIQVHLPSNGTEEVYLNIFNALRKTFQ